MNLQYKHITPSANITINLSAIQLISHILNQYEEKIRFNNLCRDGCINYEKKWSCPPYSPSFSSYSDQYQYCILLLLHCDLSQFSYIKTDYMKIKASNSILKSQADKLAGILETTFSGKALSTGSCRLCKPCSKKLLGSTGCNNPSKIRYSLEALGLNVVKLSGELFNHELLWYSNKTAPKYSSVLCGLLTNTFTNEHSLQNHLYTAVTSENGLFSF